MSKDIHNVIIKIDGKKYEVPAVLSLSDMIMFTRIIKQSKEYREALASIVHKKLIYENEKIEIASILKQEDSFWEEYVSALVENNDRLKNIYLGIPLESNVVERFGRAYEKYHQELVENRDSSLQPFRKLSSEFRKPVRCGDIDSWSSNVQNTLKIFTKGLGELNNLTQKIMEALKPFQQYAEKLGNLVSKMRFSNISDEEIALRKDNYKKWGEIGWTTIPTAPYKFFNDFPDDFDTANKMAMFYCGRESMEEIFTRLNNKKIRKSDVNSAIFCFNNKQYTACALLLFGLIDGKMIKMQSKRVKRQVGAKAVAFLDENMKNKSGEEQLFYSALLQINLITALNSFFSYGGNFINEPQIVNRNFVNHGMNRRQVRKRDCIQLFIALYNLCEFTDFL